MVVVLKFSVHILNLSVNYKSSGETTMKSKFFCLLFVMSLMFDCGFADLSVSFKIASTRFASELYQKSVENKNGNIIISPLSIQTALSMALLGSMQETEREMKSAMHYALFSKKVVASSFDEVFQTIKKIPGLNLANKLYIKKGFSVKLKFNELVKKHFQSTVELIDFEDNSKAAMIINHWIEKQTNDKIKDFINPDDLDAQTRLLIANAIYFNGPWLNQFDPKNTYKGQFYKNEKDTIEVNYMKTEDYFYLNYVDDLKATALSLPYKFVDDDYENQVHFLILLPDSKTGLTELENKLNKVDLNKIHSNLHFREITIEIPKFRIEFDIEMKEPLQKMGMKRIFTNEAQFGELIDSREPVRVSKVIHKAYLDVSEKGTQVSGATGVMFYLDSLTPPKTVNVHHPFLFVIKTRDQVLFMGRYVGV